MELVQHQIKDKKGNPIPFAKATITDNYGNAIKRNGVNITRIADNNGNVIIPADPGEYIKVTAIGKSPELSSATYSSDVVLNALSTSNRSLFFINPYLDLLATGIITAAITFTAGMAIKKLFNA